MAGKTYNAAFPVIEYYEGWLLVCIFSASELKYNVAKHDVFNFTFAVMELFPFTNQEC